MSPYREPATRDEYIEEKPMDYSDVLRSMWWSLNGSYRVGEITSANQTHLVGTLWASRHP